MSDTMRALVVRAEWDPKPDYKPTPWEIKEQIALRANNVFKNPTWSVEDDFPIPKIENSDDILIKVKASGVTGQYSGHFRLASFTLRKGISKNRTVNVDYFKCN